MYFKEKNERTNVKIDEMDLKSIIFRKISQDFFIHENNFFAIIHA